MNVHLEYLLRMCAQYFIIIIIIIAGFHQILCEDGGLWVWWSDMLFKFHVLHWLFNLVSVFSKEAGQSFSSSRRKVKSIAFSMLRQITAQSWPSTWYGWDAKAPLCNWVSQQDFDSQSLVCINSSYVFRMFYDNILLKDTNRRVSLKMTNDNRTRKVFVGFVCLLLVCLLIKFVLSELERELNSEENLLLLQRTEVGFPAAT